MKPVRERRIAETVAGSGGVREGGWGGGRGVGVGVSQCSTATCVRLELG